MSIKKCAREECGKTVYSIEELKCLDKIWHKQCFKCSVCGMTLNMKNYKGYDKKPYCEPHYPKTVASVVTDTPEMRRLAETTKFQSQINYHADYEKMKGMKIQITDDPELTRHLQNSRIQSQVLYHDELEKKKLQDTNRPKKELENEIFSSTVPIKERHVGSIADYDPMNGNWGTTSAQNKTVKKEVSKKSTENVLNSTKKISSEHILNAKFKKSTKGFSVKALYDYIAADNDEVSFKENDIIVNCEKVDDGWMTGTVQRTRAWGMLPANYVEKFNQPTGLYKLK